MSLLRSIAFRLRKYPKTKRMLKNIYQKTGYLFSDKKTEPKTIRCISSDNKEHMFGYYDKSPWDASGTKMIYMQVNGADKFAASSEPANIILKDLTKNKEKIIAQTRSWNVQQGCMLQWLGPDFKNQIIYNDFQNGNYCSIIHNIATRERRVLPMPVYSVSSDGRTALTLDFARLNTFRPGYGYCNLVNSSAKDKCADATCIWHIDIDKGDIKPLFTYKSLFNFQTRPDMKGAFHKVNHIMVNPSGDRFMFLHRWILGGVKYDRLITADMDGGNPYILLDEDMVSHCNWKNDKMVITWARTHEDGNHYYILKDKTTEKKVLVCDKLVVDGHPSYSPDCKYIITDTYPSFKRKQSLFLIEVDSLKTVKIAEVYANPKYKNENRCDLHPRWKRDSSEICFDGAQGKYRQVYSLKLEDVIEKND